jgi:hypothetical protein
MHPKKTLDELVCATDGGVFVVCAEVVCAELVCATMILVVFLAIVLYLSFFLLSFSFPQGCIEAAISRVVS